MFIDNMSSAGVLYIVLNCAWLLGTRSVHAAEVYEEDNLGDEAQWLAWKLMFGKNYSNTSEDQHRKEIWQNNLKVSL